MKRGLFAVVAVAVVVATGCTAPKRPAVSSTPPALVADEDRLPWAANEPWFVVIRKSCRTLDVYRNGERVRSYSAVFGMGGIRDPKLYEGDRRTPVGLYSIIEKRRHPRWGHFFLLDYPNERDTRRYWVALQEGAVPPGAGVGGAVGIHGTDKPNLNRLNVDWTWGCISLANSDVEDLNALIPVGTPVLIEP
jgi:murein L,D-transpeptidase YafK